MSLTASGGAVWSPNQQAVRARIAAAAARLVSRAGLDACTIRAVAHEAGLTKSTVHYYVTDANELVDLAVLGFFDATAAHARGQIDEAPDGRTALAALVRIFTGRAPLPLTLRDPTLWSSYASHASRRGAGDEVVRYMDTFSSLFEAALERAGVGDTAWRARSIHHYLLGTVQRNIVDPLPRAEIAATVSALSGIDIDPDDC